MVANERVSRKGGGAGMTLAHAAQRAIQLGGAYDGHELPPDINKFTVVSATALAGQGLLAVAKDKYPHDGNTFSFVATFAEIEADVETGQYHILDFLAYADVGTVLHPRALGGQILGRSILGIGHTIGQKWVYDQTLRLGRVAALSPHQAADDFGHSGQDGIGAQSKFPIRRRPSVRAASASRRLAAVVPPS